MSATTGRQRAYDYLRAALLSDPSLSGTFINEQSVADAVGVSRTPVREAMLILQAEELIELVPNRGAFVPPLTPEDVRDILDARIQIETWAVREVLQTGSVPLAEMRDRLSEQQDLESAGGSNEFIATDRDFHHALVRAAGNHVMTRMYEVLRARHVTVGVGALEGNPRRRTDVLAEHQAIVDALASGDPARAQEAIVNHLEATRRMLLRAHRVNATRSPQ